MSKFGALIVIIVLLVGVFYVYDANGNNVGVKIEKLKLKYTIGDNASPNQILLFSTDLSNLAKTATNSDKKRLLFESKLWSATGIAKGLAEKLGTGENFADNCNTTVVIMKKKVDQAKADLEDAKSIYAFVKDQYSNLEQKDIESRMSSVGYSLTMSDDMLYIFCPE